MKFVTVMDMWLLIINLVLLGFLFYGGRRLMKILGKVSQRLDTQDIEKERASIIKIIDNELDIHTQASSMAGNGHNDDVVFVLEEIKSKIQARGLKNKTKEIV
jgi:hypothetical protein